MGQSKWLSPSPVFKLGPALIVGQMGAKNSDNSPTSDTERKAKKRFSHTRSTPVKIPKGLIGAKYTAHVLIDGQACNCLLDTGSQVTTVSQSFYENNLSNLDIHPLNELLEVEAANGQTVPYSGFIEVNIIFPKYCFGSEITTSTFALVVPDTQSNAPSTLLIGTNTLDLVYESCAMTHTDLQALPYGCRVVLKIMQQRNKQKENSSIGLVRLSGKDPEVVPAGQSRVLEGLVHVNSQTSDRWVVIEPPASSSLPGGVLVTSCLLSLPDNPSQKLPVVLRNESEHDIIVPAKSVIAEIHALQEVVSSKQNPTDRAHSDSLPKSPENFEFNFGGSPLPAEWRDSKS